MQLHGCLLAALPVPLFVCIYIAHTGPSWSATCCAEIVRPIRALQLCLVMDEVDGMSAGDRGGVADLIQVGTLAGCV